MDISGISQQTVAAYQSTQPEKTIEKKNQDSEKTNRPSSKYDGGEAAKYTKSEKQANAAAKKQTTTVDIEKLKADAERQTEQLRSIVEKMLMKQGEKFVSWADTAKGIEEGIIKVDPEISARAAKEVADDGYWGVEQTSDRLLDFAKALAGNDPKNADSMLEAIKKGYEQATKSWGDELPELCKRTLDATVEKMNKWKEEANSAATATESGSQNN